ncbi:hypothetical protein ADIARSV_1762 [Arcticibacter svalbardensis MN12-7]|uniref:Uncharacterized protein n=1 Tax=Arcticibacter svalbardensis MN12-7 TaxID=1150600 RepID=R9GT80_9SPHI|nr:hypothetical protein ADIARSV_1762 [Arcticibacter svalbardensis MN12-7]
MKPSTQLLLPLKRVNAGFGVTLMNSLSTINLSTSMNQTLIWIYLYI